MINFIKNSMKINCKNLFIVSHLGQLAQVQSLIKYEKLRSCFLLILYTSKNTKMPKTIKDSYDVSLFSTGCSLFELPISPNNFKFLNLIKIYFKYKKLIDNSKFDRVYLLSYENHYSILINYIKNKNHNAITNLIEEGTAIYQPLDSLGYTKKIGLIKKLIYDFFFPHLIWAYYPFLNFDNIYTAFPHLIENKFLKSKINKFLLYNQYDLSSVSNSDLSIIRKYNLSSDDIFFVNQRYPIEDNEYAYLILNILREVSFFYKKRIVIKLHPKESDNFKKILSKNILKSDNIVVLEFTNFLIEPLLYSVKPYALFGITSSTLIYYNIVSKKTLCFSIAPYIIKYLKEKNNYKAADLIENHYNICKMFNSIKFIEDSNEFIPIDDKNLYCLHDFDDKYLLDAQNAYNNGNYYKCLINYSWAYGDVLNIKFNDLNMPLVSLYKDNNNKLINNILNELANGLNSSYADATNFNYVHWTEINEIFIVNYIKQLLNVRKFAYNDYLDSYKKFIEVAQIKWAKIPAFNNDLIAFKDIKYHKYILYVDFMTLFFKGDFKKAVLLFNNCIKLNKEFLKNINNFYVYYYAISLLELNEIDDFFKLKKHFKVVGFLEEHLFSLDVTGKKFTYEHGFYSKDLFCLKELKNIFLLKQGVLEEIQLSESKNILDDRYLIEYNLSCQNYKKAMEIIRNRFYIKNMPYYYTVLYVKSLRSIDVPYYYYEFLQKISKKNYLFNVCLICIYLLENNLNLAKSMLHLIPENELHAILKIKIHFLERDFLTCQKIVPLYIDMYNKKIIDIATSEDKKILDQYTSFPGKYLGHDLPTRIVDSTKSEYSPPDRGVLE